MCGYKVRKLGSLLVKGGLLAIVNVKVPTWHAEVLATRGQACGLRLNSSVQECTLLQGGTSAKAIGRTRLSSELYGCSYLPLLVAVGKKSTTDPISLPSPLEIEARDGPIAASSAAVIHKRWAFLSKDNSGFGKSGKSSENLR